VSAFEPAAIKALTFDVFGTVVDWRGSLIREGQALGRAKGLDHVDWAKLADSWRGLYQPQLERVRSGAQPWTKLDDLHRESLGRLLDDFGIAGLSDEEIETFNRAWHRLDPWPDAVPGLSRLKRRFILATLSNGNVALIVNMARHAGLPWDAVLGAEVARHYKPQPEAYLVTADLAAASKQGFRTAFVHRRTEYGPGQTTNLRPEGVWDVVAEDFLDLAAKLDA
jgi:2-haloacid dehalogenase